MSSTQGISLSQDGSGLKSVEIDLLQSRFAALSHVAATGPKHHLSRPPTAVTPARRLGRGQCGVYLDHHISPHGDEGIARKRQKGSQDVPEFALGDKSHGVEESSPPHGLNPLASPFDNTPIGITFSPILITSDTEASILVPFPKAPHCSKGGSIRVKKKHSAAKMFLGHFDETNGGQGAGSDEGIDAESLIIEQTLVENTIEGEVNEKSKNMKIDHGVQKSGGTQGRVGPATAEPLAKELGIAATVSEELPQVLATERTALETEITSPGFKPKDNCFKKLPEVVLTRYPRMARYLGTLAVPENSTRQAVPTPSTVDEGAATLPQEIVGGEVGTTERGGPVDITPEDKIIEPGDGVETPIFELVPRRSRRKAVRVQGITVESRVMPVAHLDRPAETPITSNTLEGTASLPVPDTIPVKPVSPRPRLPERYAIPVTAQSNEFVAQKHAGESNHGVRGIEKTEEELLMEQLALIDERFSRESRAHPDDEMPSFSLSRENSTSTEASIKFSISPVTSKTGVTTGNKIVQANAPPQTPKKVDETGLEDRERFRRSMGPSPSPHAAHASNISATNYTEVFVGDSINNTGAGKSEQRTAEWTIAAGNWLNKFSSAGKPTTPALPPRGQPSVLARIHSAASVTSDANATDNDGVAPGEWIKPVGLSKKTVKPKIGITAELAPLLFQPAPAPPIVRSMVGSVTGSTVGSAHGWTKVVPNQPNQYPETLFPESGTSIDRPSSKIAKSNPARVEAEENARAKEKEKVILEWRERGFTEVGRMGEMGPPALGKRQVGDPIQRLPDAVVFRSDSSGSEADTSERPGRRNWVTPREGGLFASPPRAQMVNRKAQEDRVMLSRDSSPARVQNRMAFGCGSSPAPIQSPIRQQEQLVDPNVQELANILKNLQKSRGAKPKVGIRPIQANDSFSKTWQDSIASQAPKISQAPIIVHTPVVGEDPVISQVPVVHQAPTVSQVPISRQPSAVSQMSVVRGAPRPPPALVASLAPGAAPGILVDVEPPAPSAYSGTFVDKRFATPEVLQKEAMARAEKEKERDKALETLIKQSRDEADRKLHDSGSAARMKNRNIRVAAGVVVGKNAKGEMDWIISNPPPPPPPKSTDEPNDGGGAVRARRHCR